MQVNAEGQTIGSFNLWLQANEVSSGLEMPECPMKVPKSTGFIQSPLVFEIPFATINGTCYPRHHSKYSDQYVGLLRVFMAAGRLNMDITDNNKSISSIVLPCEEHASLSEALHDNMLFKSRPASLYRGVGKLIKNI
jgi:hypothetical protein